MKRQMKSKQGRQGNRKSELEIEILYEDRHLLVAVKPPGMLSQGDITRAPDMLTEIKQLLWEKSGRTRRPFLALVHRLDRPTSGLMVFARSSKAASRLAEAFRARQVIKEYIAITRGIPEEESGDLTDWISTEKEAEGRVQVRSKHNEGETIQNLKTHMLQKKRVHAHSKRHNDDSSEHQKIRSVHKRWVDATLSWRRLSTDLKRNESLLLITLWTGRKHQIRAQFAANKMPLLGDRRYGQGDARDRSVPTVALHACRLTFLHPVNKTVCSFTSFPDINHSFSERDHLVLKEALDKDKRLSL